ncbi:MAG: hypothetical protein IKM55_00825 [Bacilli bacterium]|nr:hypothetical protein [Bacilli bacterium]
MSNEYKDEVLRKLSVYFNNFSEEQLAEYEDEIFTERIDKKKRAELEFARGFNFGGVSYGILD